MKELTHESTLREVADMIEETEGEVWEEYVGGFPRINGEIKSPSKVTLDKGAPHGRIYAIVEPGGSEGIYLSLEAPTSDGTRNYLLTAKTLGSPYNPDTWTLCWLSASRIMRTIGEIGW